MNDQEMPQNINHEAWVKKLKQRTVKQSVSRVKNDNKSWLIWNCEILTISTLAASNGNKTNLK